MRTYLPAFTCALVRIVSHFPKYWVIFPSCALLTVKTEENNGKFKMSNDQSDGNSGDMNDERRTLEISEGVTSENTLLIKSREKYEAIYNKFMSWMKTTKKDALSEAVLLQYFVELAEKMKPSSLWSHYSMLKNTINRNDKIDIGRYRKLNQFLKIQSTGFKSKQTKVLTPHDIERFLNEACDHQFLATKVALIFGIIGACRRQELCSIKMSDIEDDGVVAAVTIPKTEFDSERTFTICGEFYTVFKKYCDLRPKHVDTQRFFLNYQNGKCTNQVIGINKFGSMPKTIASFLKLPDSANYTGHSFRRTSATLLADSGADLATLRRHGGWKSKVARHFIEYSKERKRRICQKMTDSVCKPSTSVSSNQKSCSNEESSGPPDVVIEPDVDPLFVDCDTDVKQESEERTEAENTQEIITTSKIVENIPTEINVMQANVQSNPSMRPLKISSPPIVRPQMRNIASAPAFQPKSSAKSVCMTSIPLKVNKQGPPSSIKMLPKQRNVPVPQNISQPTTEVCLRWNSYHSNMQTSFPSLLDSEEFVDVTLACEGKSVKCHKIILSSCSDYLAALLRENPCQHPIILMKDLKFWEVEALVKFMYKGEVNVAHDKLPQLLNAAEALQVKGLAGPAPSQNQQPPTTLPHSRLQPSSPSASSSPSSEFKDPKTSVSSKQHTILKRGTKRSMDPKDSRPFIKMRMQASKPPPLRPSSPPIKLEPLDIPLSDNDIFPETHDDNSTNYENLITMHEADDPGEPDSADGDLQFKFHRAEDITEVEEQMEFVPTDFLEQEHDADSSRNSLMEIRNDNTQDEINEDEDDDQHIEEDDEEYEEDEGNVNVNSEEKT